MTDGRSTEELGRRIDDHDAEFREIRRDYLTEKLFLAMHQALTERVLNLEKDKASRRNALLAVAGTLVGVAASALITWLITKGGGH